MQVEGLGAKGELFSCFPDGSRFVSKFQNLRKKFCFWLVTHKTPVVFKKFNPPNEIEVKLETVIGLDTSGQASQNRCLGVDVSGLG